MVSTPNKCKWYTKKYNNKTKNINYESYFRIKWNFIFINDFF